MSGRIYMKVIVRNESPALLRLKDQWTSGDWTPGGWSPERFAETPPQSTLQWQAEGDIVPLVGVPWDGVEARVRYDVVHNGDTVGELHIFANSPVVESQYGNTFRVHAPPGFYAAYVDAKGQGKAAVLEISFRKTRRVAVRGFKPSIHGLQFSNTDWSEALPVVTLDSLWNTLTRNTGPELREVLGISPVPLDGAIFGPITRADQGLCGGMVYTVMDYFHAAQTPPLPTRQDAAGRHLPPDQPDDPLFLHIRERLLDSFDILGRGHRWLSYTSPIYPDDDEGVAQSLQLMKGKSWVTYREEWPRIRELLDAQRLVPIGLVQADNFDIGKNHQVLAYAYEQSGQNVKLWIYDPNVPAQDGRPVKQGEPADEIPVTDDLFLEFDITDTSRGVSVTRHHYAKSNIKTIYAILWLDNYVPKNPPVPGLPLPPAVNERYVKVNAATPKVTVRAEDVRRTAPGRCGNVLRFGVWTTDTSQRFVAVPGGFISPKVKWTVGGVALEEGGKRFKVRHDGQEFGVNVEITMGGTCLSLTSDVGDRYLLSVVATVSDVLGPPVDSTDEVLFEVAGGYEGMHPDDLRTEARCIAESVPVPHDLLKFTAPKHDGPQPDWNQWKADRLEALKTDPNLAPAARGAIEDYVRLQASGPEFRQAARQLAQRVKFGPK